MQPFFKSINKAIIPFDVVFYVQPHKEDSIVVSTKATPPQVVIIFDHNIDKETQLKNYEDYLINQYKLKEL